MLILLVYFSLLTLGVICLQKKMQSGADFVLGNRSLGFWLTSFSAHASDMSAWLFLGYPALVFTKGITAGSVAIGLILGMLCNWQFVAKRLRKQTEELGSLTLNSYFSARCQDKAGYVRFVASGISLFFFTCYVAAGLVALGLLSSLFFGISPLIGSSVGLALVVFYVLLGGYHSIAWIDLLQGCFLLGVLLFVATYSGKIFVEQGMLMQGEPLGGWGVFTAVSWGLGYFGQPQILTKFMGIAKADEIRKAKYVGLGWQGVTLGSATVIGLAGATLFSGASFDTHYVFIEVVRSLCPSWLVGIVLCAIVAATTNVMAAQLLVASSSLSEDLYRARARKEVSSKQLLNVSRAAVVCVAAVAFVIALFCASSVYQIVLYAWSGLGASFGPLVLLSLYSSKIHPYGATVGMIVGGVIAAVWPLINAEIPALMPGFFLGGMTIYFVSKRFALQSEDRAAL